MAKPNTQPVIVHLSTYPPRVCGIASFTFDLVSALDRLFNPALSSRVLAMAGPGDRLIPGRKKILGYLKRDDPRGYARAAARLNRKPEVKLISIQHEFGIFGGPRGRHLLLFLRALSKPAIITFHTVLPEPDRSLRQLVRQIASRVQKIVVMTAPSRDILVRDYGLRPGKIKIIPHGIHAFDYALPDRYKQRLGFNPKTIIFSTFGLLSRGKGTEYVLRSLPAIIKKYPRLIYLVLGPTHPEIIRQEGESYRRFLEKLVRELKLQRHVRFRNAYLPLPKLLDYLQATDIYISASLEPRQAVSGTLCYALGAGRPVIATPSAQAQSLITPETGRLAGFRDAETITKAALELLASQNQLRQMGQNAYFRTRHMTWENVALSYARLFSAVVPELALYNVHLPPIKLNHLAALTGPNGIFQFARLSVPDRSSGLTLDDNARALIAAMRYYQTSRDRTALRLSKVYLRFMDRALSRSGRFRNYFDEHMSPNAQMENKDNQEDADARALRVLMELSAAQAAPAALRRRAGNILARRFKSGVHFAHPRAMALYIIGLSYG
ncbi:MAG TPA: glycosyltransferase, partial [Patescibacteria group bacterium]|nr:glycosyltransferase [Patescibacteria group bacterium]